MATVRLTLDEAASGYVPETCLKCGQKADHWVTKKFSWHPPWVFVLLLVNLLVFIIVAAILSKRATMLAPMCTAHRRHWVLRTAFTVIGLFALIGLVVWWAIAAGGPPGRNDDRVAIIGYTLLGATIAWIIAIIVLNFTSVRAQSITDRDITLVGVSEQFADDFDRCLEEEEEVKEKRRAERPRARGPRDDDDRIQSR